MTFRTALFWVHLAAGLVCGLVIAVLCVTGTLLAFEKELTAWSERDARRVVVPAGATPLPLAELRQRLAAAHPEAQPASIVVSSDPGAAVAFVAGRAGTFYADPYSGEIRRPASTAVARFLQATLVWHRYLGFSDASTRPHGKLVTGIATLAFCGLAVTGLYLWMPRSWSWRAVRPSIWFRQNVSGRTRDFNWHNTIGFWCAPVLIALTLTAVPISFRWGGELLYTITGTPLPASGPQSSGAPPPVAAVPPAPAGTPHLGPDRFLDAARRTLPAWQTATLRLPAPGAAQPFSVVVREHDTWPRTALTTLQYNPFTGDLLRRDGYAELDPARKIRAWTRFLHTGEALGPVAQFVAGLASLGGLFLVYTGFALSWRRFFSRSTPSAAPAKAD